MYRWDPYIPLTNKPRQDFICKIGHKKRTLHNVNIKHNDVGVFINNLFHYSYSIYILSVLSTFFHGF